MVEDLDGVFKREAHWDGSGGSSFTVDDRTLIPMALAGHSNTPTTSRVDLADLVIVLVDMVEASQAPGAET